ncbi:MAG: hypothetical protein K8L97_11545 [Anaerolineae bacterium]|nr:hypothetical protein [Anaerolineae bacterium]
MDDSLFEDDDVSQILDPNSEKMPPDHIGVLIAGAVFMLAGWAGLYNLVTVTRPFVGQRWMFFLLLQVAITGTVLPFVRYLNVRFTPVTSDLPPGGVIVRQSIWIGLFVVLCAWLQIPRVLNLPIAFFLGLVFVVIEAFLRSREIRNERTE